MGCDYEHKILLAAIKTLVQVFAVMWRYPYLNMCKRMFRLTGKIAGDDSPKNGLIIF
ncbi:MAG: hypothetical protein ACJAVV_000017 [Alphaproteobacteria bacterium]